MYILSLKLIVLVFLKNVSNSNILSHFVPANLKSVFLETKTLAKKNRILRLLQQIQKVLSVPCIFGGEYVSYHMGRRNYFNKMEIFVCCAEEESVPNFLKKIVVDHGFDAEMKTNHCDFNSSCKQFIRIKGKKGGFFDIELYFVKCKNVNEIQNNPWKFSLEVLKTLFFEQMKCLAFEVSPDYYLCLSLGKTDDISHEDFIFSSVCQDEYDVCTKSFFLQFAQSEQVKKFARENLQNDEMYESSMKIFQFGLKLRNVYRNINSNFPQRNGEVIVNFFPTNFL